MIAGTCENRHGIKAENTPHIRSLRSIRIACVLWRYPWNDFDRQLCADNNYENNNSSFCVNVPNNRPAAIRNESQLSEIHTTLLALWVCAVYATHTSVPNVHPKCVCVLRIWTLEAVICRTNRHVQIILSAFTSLKCTHSLSQRHRHTTHRSINRSFGK